MWWLVLLRAQAVVAEHSRSVAQAEIERMYGSREAPEALGRVMTEFIKDFEHRTVLRRMEERARQLALFLNATQHTTFLRDDMPQISMSGGKDYEVSVCPDYGVAFVHIYKAAGTTGKALVERGCPSMRHQYCCCGCNAETRQVVCHVKNPDGDVDWATNVTTTFAFVRDPLERFQSGIFELARRNDPWLLPLLKQAESERRTVADVVIDDLWSRHSKDPIRKADPHIMPQTYFLNDAGTPVSRLKYIARIGPQFTEELQALGLELFHVHPRFFEMFPKMNSAHNSSYGHHHLYIHDELLEPETRTKIYKYYHVDYSWMGGLQ